MVLSARCAPIPAGLGKRESPASMPHCPAKLSGECRRFRRRIELTFAFGYQPAEVTSVWEFTHTGNSHTDRGNSVWEFTHTGNSHTDRGNSHTEVCCNGRISTSLRK
jgi:hypothetical protein